MPIRLKQVCKECYKRWVNYAKDGVAVKATSVQGNCGLCLKEKPIIAEVYRNERY